MRVVDDQDAAAGLWRCSEADVGETDERVHRSERAAPAPPVIRARRPASATWCDDVWLDRRGGFFRSASMAAMRAERGDACRAQMAPDAAQSLPPSIAADTTRRRVSRRGHRSRITARRAPSAGGGRGSISPQ